MAILLPLSAAAGFAAGLAAGQIAKNYARDKGLSANTQDVIAQVVHWAASSLTGSALSNIIDPITTVAHPVTTAPTGALLHNDIMDFMNKRGRIPSLR
jgi:hypothetical protein